MTRQGNLHGSGRDIMGKDVAIQVVTTRCNASNINTFSMYLFKVGVIFGRYMGCTPIGKFGSIPSVKRDALRSGTRQVVGGNVSRFLICFGVGSFLVIVTGCFVDRLLSLLYKVVD